jgi:TonB family protein
LHEDDPMRFIWFSPAPHGPTALPGTLLSVAAHAVLLGAVAYGHGPSSDLLSFRERMRPVIYYLPPPDRVAGQRPVEERITWVEIGAGGAASGVESPFGQQRRGTASGQPTTPQDAVNRENTLPADVVPVDSPDSVYSILDAEQSAVRVEGSAAPVYPPDMLARNIEGTVHTRYVIDTTGRADSSSLEILAATNASFEGSVRAALPGMRFLSAQVEGRRVRQMVEQEFQFRITAPVAPLLPVVPAEHTRTRPPA